MRIIDERGHDRLVCDGVSQREGRGWERPCQRRVVVESLRSIYLHGGREVYSMHYCERHRAQADQLPSCVVEASTHDVAG